jgi:hypothetical protein
MPVVARALYLRPEPGPRIVESSPGYYSGWSGTSRVRRGIMGKEGTGVFRVSRTRMLLAVIVSAPTAAISVWSITRTLSQMFDPCVRWDASGGTSVSVSLGSNALRKSVTVHGESKLRAGLVSALVPGVVLVSAVLATIGVAVSRPRLIFGGAVLMLAETLVAFTIAPLTLITGLLYLLLASWAPRAVPARS